MAMEGQDQKQSQTQAARAHAERLKKTALHNPKEFIKRIILSFMAQKVDENPSLSIQEKQQLLLEGLQGLRDLSYGPPLKSFTTDEARKRYQQFQTIFFSLVERSEIEAGNRILGQLQKYNTQDLCDAVFASTLRKSKTVQALQAMGIERAGFEAFLNQERVETQAKERSKIAETSQNKPSRPVQKRSLAADASIRALSMGMNMRGITDLLASSSRPITTEPVNADAGTETDTVSEGFSDSPTSLSSDVSERSVAATTQVLTPVQPVATEEALSPEEQQLQRLQNKANQGNEIALVKYLALSLVLDTMQEVGNEALNVTPMGWTCLLFEGVRQLYGLIHPWEKQESDLLDDQVDKILARLDRAKVNPMVNKLESKSQKELYDTIFSATGKSKTAEALKKLGVEEDQVHAKEFLSLRK